MRPRICHNHSTPVTYMPVYRDQPCPACGLVVTLEDRHREQVKRLPTPKTLTGQRLSSDPCPSCGSFEVTVGHTYCSKSCAAKARAGMVYNTAHGGPLVSQRAWTQKHKAQRLTQRLQSVSASLQGGAP